MTRDDFKSQRREMIERQLRARGITDEGVLRAMEEVPRELFVPEGEGEHAYEDHAVAIAHGQTISQPYIVAFMTETLAAQPHHRVLEVGTGSGYQSAILGRLVAQVLSIERLAPLCETAAAHLAALGVTNVTIREGDGSVGAAEFAPFDRILVTAAAPQVPPVLTTQLADGGRMVLPVGADRAQTVTLIVRSGRRLIETPLLPCRFVRLVGRGAWAEDSGPPT